MNRQQTDPGLRVVRDVFEQLQIDDAWSLWEERGFRWWPHRRAQHVWADPPVTDGHLTVSLVHAEAEFLAGADEADLSPRLLDAHLGVMAGPLSLHSLLRDGDRVRLHATAFVHEENEEWVSRLFQVATLVQATNAELRSAQYAELLGLVPATSEHPISGARPEPDEMLDALDSLASPREVWGDADEYAAIAEALGARGLLSTAGEDGLTVEFPAGPDGGPVIAGGQSNLLTVAPESRRVHGHGVRLILRLRDWPRDDGQQLFPPELNSFEAQGLSQAHLLGSWAIEDDPYAVPHFTAWLPNVLYRPGMLMNLVLTMGVRSRWVSDIITEEHSRATRPDSWGGFSAAPRSEVPKDPQRRRWFEAGRARLIASRGFDADDGSQRMRVDRTALGRWQVRRWRLGSWDEIDSPYWSRSDAERRAGDLVEVFRGEQIKVEEAVEERSNPEVSGHVMFVQDAPGDGFSKNRLDVPATRVAQADDSWVVQYHDATGWKPWGRQYATWGRASFESGTLAARLSGDPLRPGWTVVDGRGPDEWVVMQWQGDGRWQSVGEVFDDRDEAMAEAFRLSAGVRASILTEVENEPTTPWSRYQYSAADRATRFVASDGRWVVQYRAPRGWMPWGEPTADEGLARLEAIKLERRLMGEDPLQPGHTVVEQHPSDQGPTLWVLMQWQGDEGRQPVGAPYLDLYHAIHEASRLSATLVASRVADLEDETSPLSSGDEHGAPPVRDAVDTRDSSLRS